MNGPVDDGMNRQTGEPGLPTPAAGASTSSGTVEYIHSRSGELSQDASQGSIGEGDRTVISQRPVAAPEEFYRSMPLSELAGMLEGRQLDHFAVEQMIGGGGMGAVFRGRDQRLDRVVAIKVIPAAKRDPETLRRFRLEAQAAAKLDHPNIARVYYVGEAEQWNYIVFEFIDGVNIRDLVEMEGPLSVDDAVYYTRQVAEALQHAHEREVVHRDIKPSNVLVTANGSAKVVDMGLARNTALDRSTADETASGVTLGTFDYISPEQARNPRDADVRSDLYSLGCTLFFMLTGHPPFPEGTALQKLLSHGSQAPPDPRGWREDLSDELFEITMKLMAKRPGDRYQTPTELISDLVMLAEVEDLPRSQSPGTMLVAHNIAQHSLVESNLPWLVAVAFLLGSTLWLASVQSLTNDFAIADLEFKSKLSNAALKPNAASPAAAAANAAAETVPPVASSAAATGGALDKPPVPNIPVVPLGKPSATAEPPAGQVDLPKVDAVNSQLPTPSAATNPVVGGLVVSAQLPDGVEPSRWESSLNSALARLGRDISSNRTDVQEIEVRGRIELRRPLEMLEQNVRIVSGAGRAAVIEVSEELVLANSEAAAVCQLDTTKLKVRGVAFEINVSADAAIKRQSLFGLRGNSQLELDSCTVTVQDRSTGNQFSVFSYNDEPDSGQSARTRAAGLTPAPSASNSSTSTIIRTAMSVFRGDMTLIRLNVTDTTLESQNDISLTHSLVAIAGSVLEIKAPTSDTLAQRFVRLLCDQSTFVTEQAFAKLVYRGVATPLVGLMRTSQSCIYWSRPQVPHVLISGARRESLLGNFNLLLLQGTNNLYDANIEELCRAYLGAETIARFGFAEASTSGWLAERASESRVRWQNPKFPKLPLRDAVPSDFAVADVLFVPGIAPKKLPVLGLE